MRKFNRAFLGIFMLAAPLGTGMGACSDSSKEEEATADLSASCTLNSECKNPLICAFARCHNQCSEDRDCPTGQRCVIGEEEDEGVGDAGVCQLDDESECNRNSDCQDGQICTGAGECYSGCETDDDCVLDNQVCTPSGGCLDEDKLDPDGDIPAEGSGGAGGAPSVTPSEGGAGGTPAKSDGGMPGEAGAGGVPGPVGTGGAGGEPPAKSDAGAPGVDNCMVQDIGNNTRETATPYTFGEDVEACLQSLTDEDFYEFTTPEEPVQGGYLVVEAKDVGADGSYYLRLFSGTDNGQIVQYYGGQGVNGAIWIPAGPGQLFRASVTPYSVIPPEYTFVANYTPLTDEYEPNDAREEAVPVNVGDELRGYLFRGYTSKDAPGNDEDWFEVDLSAGSVHAELDQPPEMASYIYLYDSTGAQVHYVYGAAGVDLVFDRANIEIGKYYFAVKHYTGGMMSGQGTTAPELEPTQYVFTITQD